MLLFRLATCFLTLASLALVQRSSAADYAAFSPDLPAGSRYAIDARKLHPTQFSLGLREVVAKTGVINRKTSDQLAAYLKEKDVPVVVGPGGTPYMTDGHHTIRALLESQHAQKTVYGHILANWAHLPPAEFWAAMQARNFTYLQDRQGRGPLAPETLPASLLEMQSDIYRGLAWAVMNAGGFAERKDVFFQEFFWADFFRVRVSWNDADDADFARAVSAAAALARTAEAAALPGYLPPSD